MSAGPLLVRGHAAVRDTYGGRHWTALARFTEDGTQLATPRGPGCMQCTCGGALSPVLASEHARWRWHRRHREEIAEVPWSDAATVDVLDASGTTG